MTNPKFAKRKYVQPFTSSNGALVTYRIATELMDGTVFCKSIRNIYLTKEAALAIIARDCKSHGLRMVGEEAIRPE